MKLKMARLQIVGLKAQLLPVVHTLHQLGCVQIDDVSEVEEISARPLRLDRDMVQMQEELGYLVARIEGLWSALGASQIRTPARHQLQNGGPPGTGKAGKVIPAELVEKVRAGSGLTSEPG